MFAVAVPDETPVTVSAYVVEFAMLPGFVRVMMDVEDDDVEISYMYDGFPVRFPLSVNVRVSVPVSLGFTDSVLGLTVTLTACSTTDTDTVAV